MSHEQEVRHYYDDAGPAYETLMNHTWHHGEPEAEARGLSVIEAAQVLESQLVSLAGLQPGDRALDFGSGVGGPTVYMATITGAVFVGVSNNEWLSGRARMLASQHGLSGRVFFHTIGDEDYKSFGSWPDSSFDAVFFYESVCHLPSKDDFFRSVFRILKPGGHLAGIDWLKRPFGRCQTDEQIMEWMAPVEKYIRIPWHGTVDGYRAMMESAGFQVSLAEDMFAGVECWGSTPEQDRPKWLGYEGPQEQLFRDGKRALDAARGAGVFTVGRFVAVRPS